MRRIHMFNLVAKPTATRDLAELVEVHGVLRT